MTQLSMPEGKKAAVNLRFFFKKQGFDIPLSLVQEGLARTRGAASFQVLLAAEKASKGQDAPAQPDVVPASRVPVKLVEFTVSIRLLDEDLLDDALGEHRLGSTEMCIEDKLGAVCVEQSRQYEYLRNSGPKVTVRPLPGSHPDNVFQLTVTAEVLNEAALQADALRCVQRAWGQGEDLLKSPVDCLYEVLCASNSRESPVELGFEYMKTVVNTTYR